MCTKVVVEMMMMMLESQRNTERRLPLFRAGGCIRVGGSGARQGLLRLGTVAEYSLVISNSHSYASSGTSHHHSQHRITVVTVLVTCDISR